MQYGGSVYILTNFGHSVFYIGVTANLQIRIQQHKQKTNPEAFASKYNCNKLVYYENFLRIEEAIMYEKKLKNWHREWKMNLISQFNPQWADLSTTLE